MKISLYTFGCTVNNYETQKMRQLFVENGDQIIENGTADVIVINSCSITSSADKNSVQLLKRLRNKYPHAIIALVGCYGESIKRSGKTEIMDADIILDNDKFDIITHINRFMNNSLINSKLMYNALRYNTSRNSTIEDSILENTIIEDSISEDSMSMNDISKNLEFSKPLSDSSLPRAFLEIQNGCDNFCSYCIVPYLRGKPVSKPFIDIKNELQLLISKGYKEIVFAGMNLALYKHMDYTLIDVLKEADSMNGLVQIRLSSLEPATFTNDFIEQLADIKKLCPHLHISLQSGNNKTLLSMNRKYTFEDYFSIIMKLRDKIKNIAITTDIIVGFPGEGEEDFYKSCNNIVKCSFSDIHIFKYSKRVGTAAAEMLKQVTEHKKSIRSTLLQGIKNQARYNYYNSFIGLIESVLFSKKHATGLWEGVTSHNIKVLVDTNDYIIHKIYHILIIGISENGEYLLGKM